MSADPLAKGADEEIIGIPRELALPAGAWTGLRAFSSPEEGEHEITRLDQVAQPRPRRELELDPSWKQPIPYAVALYRPEGAPASDTRLFWMDRLAGGSDKRLHGRASFGVGGHIAPNDGGIRAALAREWVEEVATPTLPAFAPIGLLNDDGDDVTIGIDEDEDGEEFGGMRTSRFGGNTASKGAPTGRGPLVDHIRSDVRV